MRIRLFWYMRIQALLLIVASLGACGGRQTPTIGLGYSTGHMTTASASTTDRPRAVCTPHVSQVGETMIVRTVCEVENALYQAFVDTLDRQRRAPASRYLVGFPPESIDESDPMADERAARARAAADAIVDMMDASDPVAGVGDPAGAWRKLASLPMGVLLPTLDVLERRGRLQELIEYREQQGASDPHGRLALALYLRHIPLSAYSESSVMLTDTAHRLARLAADEREQVYRYLMDTHQVPREVETLLEGFALLESADVTWTQTYVADAMATGGEAPPPITPGPWEKPENEPAELYIGRSAHRDIARHYVVAHTTERVLTNHTPMYIIVETLRRMGKVKIVHPISESEGLLRPDITNLSALHIYEIKPSARLAEARARVAMYVGVLKKAGITISLGPAGAPGTSGYLPAPGGVFIFTSPEPGIITYDYRRGSLVPVPVAQGNEGENRAYAWQLEPKRKKEEDTLLVTIGLTMVAILVAVATAPFAS